MRPQLQPGAFLRTYLGESGRFGVLVRRPGEPRLRLESETRVLLDLCDGNRRPGAIARESAERLPRPLDAAAVERILAPLVARGVLVDLDRPQPPQAARPPSGVEPVTLDDDAAARLRLVPAPATGLGCHGRGGCCRLYESVQLDAGDVGRLYAAYRDRATPAGLSIESALERERPDEQELG